MAVANLIHMKENFMGLKYDLGWHDPDRYSKVMVIITITNLALKRNMIFNEESD